MTRSPRLIGVEFGYRFDPEERVAFAVGTQLCDLHGDPVAHGLRARIRHEEAQLAQALPSTPRAHHLHPFGGLGHFVLPSESASDVTRYGGKSKSWGLWDLW